MTLWPICSSALAQPSPTEVRSADRRLPFCGNGGWCSTRSRAHAGSRHWTDDIGTLSPIDHADGGPSLGFDRHAVSAGSGRGGVTASRSPSVESKEAGHAARHRFEPYDGAASGNLGFPEPDGFCRSSGVLAISSWVGTAAAEAPIPAPSPGEPPATILSLNFEGVGTIAPTVSVPVGTAVTPVVSLAGVGRVACDRNGHLLRLSRQSMPDCGSGSRGRGDNQPRGSCRRHPPWYSVREPITGQRRTPRAVNCRN